MVTWVVLLCLISGCCKQSKLPASQFNPEYSFQVYGTKIVYHDAQGKPLIDLKALEKQCLAPTFENMLTKVLKTRIPLMINVDGQGLPVTVRVDEAKFSVIRKGNFSGEPRKNSFFTQNQNDLYEGSVGLTFSFFNAQTLLRKATAEKNDSDGGDVPGESSDSGASSLDSIDPDAITFTARATYQVYMQPLEKNPVQGYSIAIDMMMRRIDVELNRFMQGTGRHVLSRGKINPPALKAMGRAASSFRFRA